MIAFDHETGHAKMEGTYADLSAELSFIISGFYKMLTDEFGDEIAKGVFEIVLKVAFEKENEPLSKEG